MPRETLSLRIGGGGLTLLDRIGQDTGRDRSKVARALLAEALARPAIVDAAKRRLATEVEL